MLSNRFDHHFQRGRRNSETGTALQGLERRTKTPQHPGTVCRNFVLREGTGESTFVLNSPYVTLGEEGVGCWSVWASHDSILSGLYSRSSRLFTIGMGVAELTSTSAIEMASLF